MQRIRLSNENTDAKGALLVLVDTHMHTKFSTDSKMTIEEAVAKGRELNIGITITEHMDLGYPESNAFQFDVDKYLKDYNKFRSDSVMLGIEIGMKADCLQDNRNLVEQGTLDYVIGSIHVIDNIDIYHESYYRGRTKQEVYNCYFGAMLDCIKCYDFIDSLGHIDYITRYACFADTELYYHEFTEQIDSVLKVLVQNEKALEINTRRLGDVKVIETLLPIYKRFAELGGRLATIGSDAHKPQDIGHGMVAALEMAAQCSLKAVYYKDRQPHYVKY